MITPVNGDTVTYTCYRDNRGCELRINGRRVRRVEVTSMADVIDINERRDRKKPSR